MNNLRKKSRNTHPCDLIYSNKLANRKRSAPVSNLLFNFGVANSKRSQEEMVGFALIIILVAIILLIFLGFILNKQPEENIKSSEVENFINAVLSYTTECRDERNFELLSIRRLIGDCSNGLSCYDKKNTCEVLENDLKQIIQKSWDMTRYNGYEMKLISLNKTLIPAIKKGNFTGDYKGYSEEIDNVDLTFKVYY